MGAIILNADDFGWTPSINDAVTQLAAAGTLSSTSVMVTMPHVADLRRLLREDSRIGVGVHLTLTDGEPLLARSRVPALVDPAGCLHPPARLVRRLRRGRVPLSQLSAELTAQVRRARELAGQRLDHWDSHHHIHRFEPLYTLFARVCAAEGVPAMRAHKHYWPSPGGSPRGIRPGGGPRSALIEGYYRLELARCRRRFAMPRGILILDSPRALSSLRSEDLPGVFEVLTHPATSVDGLSGTSLLEDRVAQYEALRSPEVVEALAGPRARCSLQRFADLPR